MNPSRIDRGLYELRDAEALGPAPNRLARQAVGMLRSRAATLIVGRVLTAIPVLLGVSLLTFFAVDLLPGNTAEQLLGAEATPQQLAELEAALHLDEPAGARYLAWLAGVLKGDLGTSLASRQAVAALLAERMPVTLELIGYAFLLSLGFAVPTALIAAHRPNRFVDRLSTVVSMVGFSIPNYVLALLLVLIFSVHLGAFPAIGFTPLGESISRNVASLTLPAIAIAFPLYCFYSRFLRGDLLEQIDREAYVETAVAKGIGPWRVLIRHALRNSLFGLLTLVGLNLGTLIGGAVIIEQIFALPGTGQLLLQAINNRDVIVVQAVVLLLAATTVFASLCCDLLYAVLDPRISYDPD